MTRGVTTIPNAHLTIALARRFVDMCRKPLPAARLARAFAWHTRRCGTLVANEGVADLADKEFEESPNDGLLASQWGEPSTAHFLDLPERRLLVAVLVDAVRVLVGKDPRERAGVLRWIKGDDARITFRELCHNLELDPDATTRKLLESAQRRDDTRGVSTRRVACIGRRSGVHERQLGRQLGGDQSQAWDRNLTEQSVASATHDAA